MEVWEKGRAMVGGGCNQRHVLATELVRIIQLLQQRSSRLQSPNTIEVYFLLG